MDSIIEKFRRNIENELAQLIISLKVTALTYGLSYLTSTLISSVFIKVDTCSYLDVIDSNNSNLTQLERYTNWIEKYMNVKNIDRRLIPM